MSSDPAVPAAAPPRRTNTRALAAVMLLVCFAVGILVGGASDRALLMWQHRLIPRGAAGFTSQHVVDRLDRELKLSPAQRQQITLIVERRHTRINAIWAGMRPQVRAEVEGATAEISNVLTPEQRAKFEQLRQRVHRRMHWLQRDSD